MHNYSEDSWNYFRTSLNVIEPFYVFVFIVILKSSHLSKMKQNIWHTYFWNPDRISVLCRIVFHACCTSVHCSSLFRQWYNHCVQIMFYILRVFLPYKPLSSKLRHLTAQSNCVWGLRLHLHSWFELCCWYKMMRSAELLYSL